MSVTAKSIVSSQFAPGSAAALYTAPVNTRTIIDKFIACNTDGSTQTLTVNIVPSGGSVATSNINIDAFSILTTVTKDFTELQNVILNSGDFISVTASAASKITVNVSGRECV